MDAQIKKNTAIPARRDPNYWKYRGKNMKVNAGPVALTPIELWGLACEYFEYCENNPRIQKEAIKNGQSAGVLLEIPKTRVFNIKGMLGYINTKLGTSVSRFYNQLIENENDRYDDYKDVLRDINDVIETEKYEGAAIGEYNSSMIIRDLGFADKQEIDVPKYHPIFGPLIDNKEEE